MAPLVPFLLIASTGLSLLSTAGVFESDPPDPPDAGSKGVEDARQRALREQASRGSRQGSILTGLSTDNTVQTSRPILLGEPGGGQPPGGPQPGAGP